jgi:hypothetical protein
MQARRIDCSAGVTDGNGTIALTVSNVLEPSNAAVHFLGPDGSLLAQNTSTNAVLTGQLSGFEGQVWAGGTGSGPEAWKVRLWDSRGITVAEGPVRSGNQGVAEDPLGGIVVVDRSSARKALESYDEHLHLRWRVDITDRALAGFAVDRAGRALVLFDADYNTAPQSVDAVWVDHDGTKGPVFRALGKQSYWPHLGIDVTQRVGSGLFFRTDRWWQIDSLAVVVQPPPDWFARRPFSGLHMVHGGTGYAVLPDGCGDTIEVVAPSGTSCGTAKFTGASGSCTARTLAVGYDGTVIEQLPPPAGECNGESCTCTWQWWPGFFR